MATNGMKKGKEAEREFARAINNVGLFNAIRGCQNRGGPDSPDILCDGPLFFEVKRRERLDLSGSIAQAVRDSGYPNSGRTPVVASRKNREGWLLTVRIEDVVDFSRAILEAVEKGKQSEITYRSSKISSRPVSSVFYDELSSNPMLKE